ncbi:hypothetical protein [Photobacterium leiognathi]|uniref:hypothetical protein n=1 Tax=Photobacterium leiognathi TaxID=553611 RepID=UPI002980BA17|nr:hypothetical protein [Photobacterium leiognathi]
MKGEPIFVKHPREFFARTEVMKYTYKSIAEEEYVNAFLAEEKFSLDIDECELLELESKATNHAVKAIVFSAMCLEAAINDYAGTHLGDRYFETHLSSLDVVSKWVVIPKLVCGNQLDKSSAAFGALKHLIRARNQLVHSKSREIPRCPQSLQEQIDKSDAKFDADFNNSLKAVYLLAMEMDYVVGQQYNPIGTMDSKFTMPKSRPEQLKKLFDECKNIVLQKYS